MDGVELFKALAHPLRYQVLVALSGRERNVGEIETATRIGQPVLSQQLSVLRKAGLVQTRKEAKLVFYRIDDGAIAAARGALDRLVTIVPAPAPSDPTSGDSGTAVFAQVDYS